MTVIVYELSCSISQWEDIVREWKEFHDKELSCFCSSSILFEWQKQGGWYVRSLWRVRRVHTGHWLASV